jgi:hypothetical protein
MMDFQLIFLREADLFMVYFKKIIQRFAATSVARAGRQISSQKFQDVRMERGATAVRSKRRLIQNMR